MHATIDLADIPDAAFTSLRDEWIAVGLRTRPAERAAAEAGARAAYRAAGLDPPRRYLWVGSPLAGEIAAACLGRPTAEARAFAARVRTQLVSGEFADLAGVLDAAGAAPAAGLAHRVGDGVLAWANAELRVRFSDGDQARLDRLVRAPTTVAIARGGGELIDEVLDENIITVGEATYFRDAPPRLCDLNDHRCPALRPHEILGDLAALVFARRHASPDLGPDLSGLEAVARAAGWWWPLDGLAIFAERPTIWRRDRGGEPHNRNGPAMAWPDGWRIWAIGGTRLEADIIERPHTLSFEQVRDEPDPRVRRHMLDRFGGFSDAEAHAAWLAAGGLEAVSSEDITHKMQPAGLAIWRRLRGDAPVTCRLYRVPRRADFPLAILMVVCPSTAQEIPLRVPPTLSSAAEARAWTFGRDLTDTVET